MSKVVRRGDVYYVVRNYSESGSEQHAGRPAVIVSNDINNANSDVVEVVYMTTQPKSDLPTHCQASVSGKCSTILCEQVTSIYVDRLDRYITTLTPDEMDDVDKCLLVSLGLNAPVHEPVDAATLRAERDFFKKHYNELLDKLITR